MISSNKKFPSLGPDEIGVWVKKWHHHTRMKKQETAWNFHIQEWFENKLVHDYQGIKAWFPKMYSFLWSACCYPEQIKEVHQQLSLLASDLHRILHLMELEDFDALFVTTVTQDPHDETLDIPINQVKNIFIHLKTQIDHICSSLARDYTLSGNTLDIHLFKSTQQKNNYIYRTIQEIYFELISLVDLFASTQKKNRSQS